MMMTSFTVSMLIRIEWVPPSPTPRFRAKMVLLQPLNKQGGDMKGETIVVDRAKCIFQIRSKMLKGHVRLYKKLIRKQFRMFTSQEMPCLAFLSLGAMLAIGRAR